MKTIEKVVVKDLTPERSDVVWVDTSGDQPVIRVYKNGEWVSTDKSGMFQPGTGNYSARQDAPTSKASGNYSIAENTSEASGNYSHAEGNTTKAAGSASHSEGEYTETKNEAEHAEGRSNKSNKAQNQWGAGNTIHSVGIGDFNTKKNAFEIMQDGKVYVYGIGGYDGTNPTDNGVSSLQNSIVEKPSNPTNGHLVKVNSSGNILDAGIAMVKMTKSEYDALDTKDASTVYLVEDGTPNGVYIYYTDNSMSNYDDLVTGKTPMAVAVLTDSVKLLIHPQNTYSVDWSQDDSTQISGVTTTSTYDDAAADFNGAANTAAIIASELQGQAFDYVSSKGDGWYVPAFGELLQIELNQENINTAMELISGDPIAFSSSYYWSSTQYNEGNAWCKIYDDYSYNNYLTKGSEESVIAVKALSVADPSVKLYLGSILIADSSTINNA